jgi:homoserine kinase
MDSGALGCSISGTGPAIFALCPNSLVAENAGISMKKVFEKQKIEADIYLSGINQEGAVIC